MCYIDAHGKVHQSYIYDGSNGGVCPIPTSSTTESLELIGAIIDFIGCWLKSLEHNFIERCNLYTHNVDLLFQKTNVKSPNHPSMKKKNKSLLHAIGGGWYVEKL